MKLNTLIIDDEKYSRENILAELQPYNYLLNFIGEANSVANAVQQINSLRPDLIFLDINLGDGMGFDVLEQISFRDLQIIFVTAYDEYAIKAFKFNALDYILKPINKVDVQRVIEKIIKRKKNQMQYIDEILKNLKDPIPKRIAIPSNDGLTLIELNQIVRCQSDGNYTLIFLSHNQKITASKTLKYFDDLFENSGFERVHHSHLVNVNHIKKYINSDGGILKMSDDSIVPISQRKKTYVLNLLEAL